MKTDEAILIIAILGLFGFLAYLAYLARPTVTLGTPTVAQTRYIDVSTIKGLRNG